MNTFFKRLLTIVIYARQEMSMIIKDPAIILIFIIANVIYPVIYSVAYNGEQVKELEIAVVDLDNSSSSRLMRRMIDATEGLSVSCESGSLEEAKALFYQSQVHGIVLIPNELEKNLMSGQQSSVSIYADASYFLIYKQVYSSIVQTYQTFAGGLQLKKNMAIGQSYEQAMASINPVNFQTVELFNPNSSYGSFVMPSIIIVILQQTLLIGIGILGGTRKEIQRYNFMLPVNENSNKVLPFILGKACAYFITFMIMGIFTLVWIHNWFRFPDKSHYLELLSLYVPFIIANIFLGLSISVFFKRRENAMLFMVFLSIPVLFLSGATWPVEAIPPFLHQLAFVFPSTFMVSAYQRVRTMGAELIHVRHEIYIMLFQCIFYFILAYLAFRYAMQHLLVSLQNEKEKPIEFNY